LRLVPDSGTLTDRRRRRHFRAGVNSCRSRHRLNIAKCR
jgi:hypothetical protein